MPWSGVDRDEEISVRDKRAFQKTIVWFVADDTEFGQRIADAAASDNLSDEIWLVSQHVRVLLKDGGTDPCFPLCVSSKMSADALFSPGNVASFRMQVSRTTLKIRPGAT